MNWTLVIIYSVVIAALMVFSACFSSIDMAYSSVSLPLLKENSKKNKKAAKAYRFALNYEETIVIPLFGNNIMNILASSVGTLLGLAVLPQDPELATLLVTVGMLILTLIVGEIIPKALGKSYSYSIALASSYVLVALRYAFYPIILLSKSLGRLLTKPLLNNESINGEDAVSDEELQEMVKAIQQEGIIDSNSQELLSNSIEFVDTSAYEIMTPRMKIEGVPFDENLNFFVKQEGAFRHSRIPVYKHDFDHILGYIPVKSLLRAMLYDDDLSVDELMCPVLSVPRTMEISSTLSLMKKTHIHLAIVKDEYGGTEGLLTMEDILEELVGEIYDEGDVVQLDIQKTAKRNVYLVRGGMDIEEFFKKFHLSKEDLDEDYETVSGWINDQLGAFGKEGDHFEFGPLSVKVKKASPYTVLQAEVTYHPRRKLS
ncbi:hemolysin family protein [bacterium]|nr:hemolysin family protein [bacterium]